jgi:hypothetical protein
MLHWIPRLALAVATLALSGCGLLTATSEDYELANRRVGVASLLGTTFRGASIGTTAFNNVFWEGDVADWSIDASVAEAIAARVRELRGYDVAPVQLSAEQRKTLLEASTGFSGPEELRKIARAQGFQRLLLIERATSGNEPFLRGGYGLFQRSLLGNEQRRCVYTAYQAKVISLGIDSMIGLAPIFPTCLGRAPVPWRDSFAEYSAGERALLHKEIGEQLAREAPARVLEIINQVGTLGRK